MEKALAGAGFPVRPIRSRRSTQAAASKVQHFDTYNRTAAGQRVADIVAPCARTRAPLVADGDAALAALLASAVVLDCPSLSST